MNERKIPCRWKLLELLFDAYSVCIYVEVIWGFDFDLVSSLFCTKYDLRVQRILKLSIILTTSQKRVYLHYHVNYLGYLGIFGNNTIQLVIEMG